MLFIGSSFGIINYSINCRSDELREVFLDFPERKIHYEQRFFPSLISATTQRVD
jgi:hypothetical protein